jgi:hypothetical protein
LAVVNFAYLESFLGGDKAIAVEVLELFRGQADAWRAGLDSTNPDCRAVAHAIKGAARGIGADALGDACHAAEFGSEADVAPARVALEAALAEIDAYLAA